jgi:argininosuccinate lyase
MALGQELICQYRFINHAPDQDSLEIIRGKSGRVFGQMSGVMMVLKSLPLTYNKDMAEDKEPMFDCARTVQDVIRIMEGVIVTLTVSLPVCMF